MQKVIDIPNKELPIAQVIRESLTDCPKTIKNEVLAGMSEEEFIDHRVNIFLQSLETALHAGFHPSGAEEIAFQECMAGLINTSESEGA